MKTESELLEDLYRVDLHLTALHKNCCDLSYIENLKRAEKKRRKIVSSITLLREEKKYPGGFPGRMAISAGGKTLYLDDERMRACIGISDLAFPYSTPPADAVSLKELSFPGRPSVMAAVEQEMKRRAEAGEMIHILAQEAAALSDWVKAALPGQQTPTSKAIENALREVHRSLKRPPEIPN